MRMLELGNTKIVVSEMCVGTVPLGKMQADVPPDRGAEAISRAIDLGVNFIDTAQLYRTYPHVAHAIRGIEKDLVVASKSKAANYEEMEKAIYECRKALHRQVIDIFSLHGVHDETDLNSRGWALKCILDFKEAGAVRAVGATVGGVAGLRAAADCPEIEVVMVRLNEKGIGVSDGSVEECLETARLCRKRGKAVCATAPLGGGYLIDHAVEAISFVRNLEEIDAVVVDVLAPQEAEMNVRIFNGEDIPPELAGAVKGRHRRIVIDDDCSACGRCVEVCPQGALSKKKGKKPKLDQSKCTLCGRCAQACPEFAIRVV